MHGNYRVDWTPIIPRLGTVPDSVIADELGVSRERVRQVREKNGVPSHRETHPIGVLPEACIALLGTKKDHVLAKEFGVPARFVNAARNARGIPMYLVPCPSRTRYNAGCRCAPCTALNAANRLQYYYDKPEIVAKHRAKYVAKVLASAPHKHGKVGWYVLGCRCDGCRAASNAAARRRYEKKRSRELSVVTTIAVDS